MGLVFDKFCSYMFRPVLDHRTRGTAAEMRGADRGGRESDAEAGRWMMDGRSRGSGSEKACSASALSVSSVASRLISEQMRVNFP